MEIKWGTHSAFFSLHMGCLRFNFIRQHKVNVSLQFIITKDTFRYPLPPVQKQGILLFWSHVSAGFSYSILWQVDLQLENKNIICFKRLSPFNQRSNFENIRHFLFVYLLFADVRVQYLIGITDLWSVDSNVKYRLRAILVFFWNSL